MFEARFYKFSKRENSTMRPADNAGLAYSISLKKDTDLNHPEIVMDFGTSLVPDFNYVRIPQLGRYYFIERWTYIDHRMWSASCDVDVLATYKDEIGFQNHYVVRSASRRDNTISDMLFPLTTDASTQSVVFQSLWLDHDEIAINNGSFVVGIDSYDAHYGSVDYFILGYNDISDLCDYLINDMIQNGVNGFSNTDATIALQRSLVNPLQFIKSCIWFPIPYNTLKNLGTAADVYCLSYDTGVDGYKLGVTAVYEPSPMNLTKLHHPQYDDHGSYMDASPFTSVQLKIPPFGIIDLDATVIANAGSLSMSHYVDLITGKVIIELKSGVKTLNRLSTQLGVPIQLSQVTRDYLGAVTGIMGAVASAASFNFIGAMNGINNMAHSAAPKCNSVGSNGGFADLYGDVELMYTFYTQTEIDNDEKGRPLMKRVQLNTLSGYMLIEHADNMIECTAEENAMIRAYMESGFYYE